MDSTAAFDNELSVDELRVFSEEELVDKAFKEASMVKSHQSVNSSDLVVHNESSLGSMGQQGANKRKTRSKTFHRDNNATELEWKCAEISESQPSVADKVEKMRSLGFISSSHKIQEFLVLGRQTLTELRDNIYCCTTDQLMQKAGQHDPSGYFLIEDVFYNDMRDPSAIDYSEPIFSWLRNCKEEALEKWESITISGDPQKKQKSLVGNGLITQLPQFRAIEMHKARFGGLHFRLGSGYLYCHQGDCKHIFVIRDMRLIHPEDVQNRAAYPILTFQLRPHWRKCSVCRTFRSTKVTIDDKWAKENPSYFCDNCYYLQHYLEDGSLLYNDFSVFDYHHE